MKKLLARLALLLSVAPLAFACTAPSFSSVAAKVPELVQCPPADASRATELVKRWQSDRDLVEQELIDQVASGPAGAAIAVCQIRDVYALGEQIGEAYTRARDALTQLKALPL